MRKAALTYIALGAILINTSCASDSAPPPAPPPPPPVVVIEPPFIPVDLPFTEQARTIQRSAGLFDSFSAETERSAKNLNTAIEIANSVDRAPLLARSETIDGAKSYALLAAANSVEFRNGIVSFGKPMGRTTLINRLISHPSSVSQIPGYDEAKALAARAIGNQYRKIDEASKTIEKAAYDLQLKPWAKVTQPKEPRLAAITAAWDAPISATDFDTTRISTAGSETAVINDRMLAAAALYILRADEEALTMLQLGTGRSCAFKATLNLRMCMSATRYPFEHAFCLKEHGQEEFKTCVADNVGVPVKVERAQIVLPPKPVPKAKAAPKTTTKAKKK